MAKGELEIEPEFCKKAWLDISDAFSPKYFFWIHRANCFNSEKTRETYDRCSDKFLEKTIHLVEPRLMLIFGGVAAGYFFHNQKMLDLVRRRDLVYHSQGLCLDCRVLFHWSRETRANTWSKRKPEYHEAKEASLREGRQIVREILVQTGFGRVS
jgi:uracil-DNA glycosylase